MLSIPKYPEQYAQHFPAIFCLLCCAFQHHVTWCGCSYRQHGGGCGRRMRSSPWTPYKRHPVFFFNHGYVLYPLPEASPVGRLHAEACLYSTRFLRGAVSALRALEEMGSLLEFISGSNPEMRKGGDIFGSGASIRGTGGAQSLRNGVLWKGIVDGVQHGRTIVRLPAPGGRGGPQPAGRAPQSGIGVPHRLV